jgi:hypothetical protein
MRRNRVSIGTTKFPQMTKTQASKLMPHLAITTIPLCYCLSLRAVCLLDNTIQTIVLWARNKASTGSSEGSTNNIQIVHSTTFIEFIVKSLQRIPNLMIIYLV